MYKEVSGYKGQEPSILENNESSIKFKVHKYSGSGGLWYLSCSELGIMMYNLNTDDIEVAEVSARKVIIQVLNLYAKKYTDAAKILMGSESL